MKRISHSSGILLVFVFFLNYQALAQEKNIKIDVDFPGGNIIVDGVDTKSTLYYKINTVENDTIYLRPDLRDTKGDWFYWHFRITGAIGKSLTFKFPEGKIADFGPAFSTNGGNSWQWLYDKPISNNRSFTYSFTKEENSVRFSMGIPYLQSNFDTFISQFKNNSYLSIGRLTTSLKGRNVEKLIIKNPSKTSKYKVVITARHHAVEAMASYELEGIIASILKDDSENMKWLRENVEFFIVPFVDKDGVQDGDQGKNRRPRDHWLDYVGKSIYKSTAAIRNQVPSWAAGKLKVAFDLHCPALNGKGHEHIYLVGGKDKEIEREQIEFAKLLAYYQQGELEFQQDNLLKYGTGWNTDENYSDGMNFATWASKIEGVSFATTSELPYSNNKGQKVTPKNARMFGKDYANALAEYLRKL